MIISLEPKHYNAWNKFCEENTWFWSRTEWLEYIKNSKFGVEYKNHSFFIEQNGHITDIVPLIQENDELFSPGFNDSKEILQEINYIARLNVIKRITVKSNIKGYLNTSGYTCILDLDNIHPTKGHKSAITKGQKHLRYITHYDIDDFKADYCRIAGKQTRPDKTFEMLGQWQEQGYGTLLTAICGDKIAGHTYILHYKNYGYYFMSCVEPEFKDLNVSHYLQSVAFNILKNKGAQRYELGEQIYNSLYCQPSEKEKNISLFKRGFGGDIVLSPSSEYYFDRDYMCQVYHDRIERYIRSEYE